MRKAVISLIDSSYSLYKFSDDRIYILAKLLLHDIGCNRLSSLKEWIFDPKYDEIDGNVTSVDKVRGIAIMYDEALENDFCLPQKQLWDVIERWEQLCKQRPKEIIITQNYIGKVSLEPNNERVPEVAFGLIDGRYFYKRSNDRYLKNLGAFLRYKFEKQGLSHSFILNEWANTPGEEKLCDGWIVVEKKGDSISVLHDPGKADKSFAFVTTKEKFREIYKKFEAVKDLKLNVISITKDGDEIKIEGFDKEI